MIRHENDLTSQRIMGLLSGQGFIANAYVLAVKESPSVGLMLLFLTISAAVSAFLMLYKSYQARGYLKILGQQAKQGHCRRSTRHSRDGLERGCKGDKGTSGPFRGWATRAICWNRGWLCRASSSSCG